jgi:membrane fusion protein, heavy metal efflux system
MSADWRFAWPPWQRRGKSLGVILGTTAAAITVVALIYLGARARAGDKTPTQSAPPHSAGETVDTLELSDAQLQMVHVAAVSEQAFPLEIEAVGSIDFNEDMAAQVFPPYQGRIVALHAKIGDNVAKGAVLFTIESPDLIQAESSLIAAAGLLDLTSHALERAKQLYEVQGIAEKDLQQAISDQQTAEGALKAARDAVVVFGKTKAEIDRMVKTRTIDPYLIVPSPLTGRVTARTAAPGDFVQPGNPPAPYAVADISRVWMNASVTESDMPRVHIGQKISVGVMAFPGRLFAGEISTVGATVDPQLHRGMVRAEIEDPKHELLPGMFANFLIRVGDPVTAPAVSLETVVREADGTMTVWVPVDGNHFKQRTVRIGQQYDGYDEILDGLRSGERVVSKGAIFLDNMLAPDTGD